MKLIEQSWKFEDDIDGLAILKKIERAGRTCYKSEDKITEHSAKLFCQRILRSGHHSVIEHQSITVRIVTNRGVTHEIVRHRLASYSQESTRYCDYGGDDIIFIKPIWLDPMWKDEDDDNTYRKFIHALDEAEDYYKDLRQLGWSPQQAREVLPNALKTEIVMTCNLREWRHFFTLRADKAAHPQMRALATDMLKGFNKAIPILFEDLWDKVLLN